MAEEEAARGGVSGASVSGFVFGSLAFQLANADSDAEGFLVGEIKSEAKYSITDFQMDDIEVENTIDIQKHIPCYRLFSFYNAAGEVDMTALQKILINQEQDPAEATEKPTAGVLSPYNQVKQREWLHTQSGVYAI